MKTHYLLLAALSAVPSLFAADLILNGATDNTTIDVPITATYDKIELSGGDFVKTGAASIYTSHFTLKSESSFEMSQGYLFRAANGSYTAIFGGSVTTGTPLSSQDGVSAPSVGGGILHPGLKVTASDKYATFDGLGGTSSSYIQMGGGLGGSFSNAKMVNGAQIITISNENDTFDFQNVSMDLSTYETNRLVFNNNNANNYTLDLTRVLTACHMTDGGWEASANRVAKWSGDITLVLDDAMFKDILDNAKNLTLTVSSFVNAYAASGIDGSDLNINIVNKSGTGTLGHFDGGGDGTSLNFTWAQNAIPEPGSVTLGLLALAGLAARRRRKA